VQINDRTAKASQEVKTGDIIEIQFGQKTVRVRVTDVKESIRKDDAKDMFEYL